MGTPALKPYKREIKTHQNDATLQEKATKNRTCNGQEKEFEWCQSAQKEVAGAINELEKAGLSQGRIK